MHVYKPVYLSYLALRPDTPRDNEGFRLRTFPASVRCVGESESPPRPWGTGRWVGLR